MKLNRLSRASQVEVSESSAGEITVPTEPLTPKSVRFADPLEEYEPAVLEDVPEKALCLAHAQISDLEAEKKAADEEMETLFVELHIVESKLHEWEEGVTARLKALEDELDDQKSEITYLHNKLLEARGQSPLLTDALGRSHPLSERDITGVGSINDNGAAVQCSDSDSDDTSSVDSSKTIRLSETSPYAWPSLFDEQFPTPPPLAGCLDKAKNILQAARGGKSIPPIDGEDELLTSPRESEASPTRLVSTSLGSQSGLSGANSEVTQEGHREEQTVGLSLQLPLATEVGSFSLPDVNGVASKLERLPTLL
ncbi:hypothetical protein FRC01_012850, partial [Tulasnella sp. 417]